MDTPPSCQGGSSGSRVTCNSGKLHAGLRQQRSVEEEQLKLSWVATGAISAGLSLCPLALRAQKLPPGAVLYQSTSAQFRGQPSPLRVVFYSIPMDSVGVIILRMDGTEVARASEENVNLGLYEGTGVYDVTGEGWPEVVLVGQAGSKTLEAKIYRLGDHKLNKIFEWSGWHFQT